MTTIEAAARRAADRDYLLNPDKWQHWPLCPIKQPAKLHGPGRSGLGVVVAGTPTKVYHALLFEIAYGAPLDKALAPFEATEYADIEAVLDAGWTVD